MGNVAIKHLAAAAAAVMLVGCTATQALDQGGAGRNGAAAAMAYQRLDDEAGWGMTTIVLEDNLGWPYALGGLLVSVDGVPLHRLRGSDRSESLLEVVELEPGDHTVQVQAVVGYASAPLSDPHDCRVTLNATESFRVGWNPARLKLDLHLSGVTEHFAERVNLAIGVRGAERVAHHVVPHLRHEIHVPDSRQAIVAGIEARMEQARHSRDVVAALCYQDKLDQARSLARELTLRDDALRFAASQDQVGHERTVMAVVHDRLRALWIETEQCVSQEAGLGPGHANEYVVEPLRTVTVSDRRACSGGSLIELGADGLFSFERR